MRHQLCNIVTLNLNTTCNLHCKWCYNQEKQHKLLKFELFVKFYDDIIKNNVTSMTLIGGEPTIHPQFVEILRKLEKQEVHLFTNAIRFSEKKFCEDVCKQKNLKDITISIKGFNEKSFKEFSDEISFVEFCSAIENLNEKGTFIRVNYNCTENLSQSMVSDFVYFLRYYGLHEIVLHDIRPYITESGELIKKHSMEPLQLIACGRNDFMTNEIIETVKSCLTLLIAILCLIFSKSRFKENKRYAVKYENSSILLILRLILTYLLKIISIIILIGICTNKLDVFIAFYVFTPMLICLQLIFFYTNDTKAMFTLVKGFYYLGLSIISLIQFLCENQNVAELALGFTLALAIFESIAAISEGIMKLQKK